MKWAGLSKRDQSRDKHPAVPDSSAMYPDEDQSRGLRDNLLPRRITESQHLVPLWQRSVFDAYAQGYLWAGGTDLWLQHRRG